MVVLWSCFGVVVAVLWLCCIVVVVAGLALGLAWVGLNIPKLRLSVAPALKRTLIHSVLLERAATWRAVFPC